MYQQSLLEQTVSPESMLSAEDGHASHSQQPGSETARQMTVISGLKYTALLQNLSPVGSVVKMLLGSLTWHSTRQYLTWKLKATKQGRPLFQLVPSTPPTGAIESGLWLTPSATNINERSEESMEKRRKWRESSGRTTVPPGSLAEQVQAGAPVSCMLPTPASRDYKGGRGENAMEASGRNSETNNLPECLTHRDARPDEVRLNPEFVREMMGFPEGWFDERVEIIPRSETSLLEYPQSSPVIPKDQPMPDNAARLKALGNAVVPAVVEEIARAILDVENDQ